MTEFDAKGVFEHINFTVEAALQAAHAISTHAVVNEVDYWTAADDLPSGQAAAMVEEAMFNSACFYKYFCLDWDQLVHNLAGPEPDKEKEHDAHRKWQEQIKPDAERLAGCTLGHFLRGAALTSPSGKQNSFASHTEPCGILVEIKKDKKTPTNYANAFAEPAERIGKPQDDAPDFVSLEGRSIAQLGDHIFNLRNAYGIDSTLLWYAMPLYRYPLQGWQRDADGRKAKIDKGKPTERDKPPVQFATKCFDTLGGEDGKPEGLVEGVMTAMQLGFDWKNVKDAGRSTTPGAAS